MVFCRNYSGMQQNIINVNKKSNKDKQKFKSIFFPILTGALAGIVNGIFGGGGGMIVVPLLIYVLKYSVQKAHATAILIILPLSLLSGIIYATYVNVNMTILYSVGGGVIAGGVLGAFALSKFSSKWLIIIFSVLMAIAGGRMLFF